MCPTAATPATADVYYGWLVGVPLNNPASVTAWATAGARRGAWAVGGVASDGVNPFVATGNTFGASFVERRRGDHPLPARPGLQRPDHRLLGAYELDGARQR